MENLELKEGKYVIIDLRDMNFMKDMEYGKITVYDTREEAELDCAMYECENAWIVELIYNYIEPE